MFCVQCLLGLDVHVLYVCVCKGFLVKLVEQQPATRCVMGSIPAGSAREVWPWTSVLNSLIG